jgi:DNA (cytosine-5)-methyltransferase 1
MTAYMEACNHERVPIILDDYGIRRLTPYECLMLQGFPTDFKFPQGTSMRNAYKQVGNSVCVPVIRRIAENIMKAMSEVYV